MSHARRRPLRQLAQHRVAGDLALGLGLVMLYMGGSLLGGLIWPPKPKDPDAPIEIPPLDQVRGRTSYRDDSTMTRNAMLVIGALFLAASLGAAAEQPIVLVIPAVAVGILAGAGVKMWRQIQYGRARLELDAPARRGDTMHGVVVARSSADASATRNGNDLTIRFTATIPVIDTSQGRFSWNIQLGMRSPKHRATFLIDVA